MTLRVAVVGAGAFGLPLAVELARRGHAVTVYDSARIPGAGEHDDDDDDDDDDRPPPAGMSHDASRIVRPDYGGDALLARWALEAVRAWEAFNREEGVEAFHRVGFECLVQVAAAAGGGGGALEAEAARTLAAAGSPVDDASPEPHPLLRGGGMRRAYTNPAAGWADAALAMRLLAARARRAGVALRGREPVEAVALSPCGTRATGVRLAAGAEEAADLVVVAAGAWTPRLVPALAGRLRPSAHPVVYYRPPPGLDFGGMGATSVDITSTGFYVFPPDAAGLVKVGHHGDTLPGASLGERRQALSPATVRHFDRFLARALPRLRGCRAERSAVCWYCDSFDADFFVGRSPDVRGLAVASGGSGHAFKFLPVMGAVAADAVTGEAAARWPRAAELVSRFAWRGGGGGGGGPHRADHLRAKGGLPGSKL